MPPQTHGGGGRDNRTMKTALSNSAMAESAQPSSLRATAQAWLPRIVLAPSFVLVLIFVYGFNLWTVFLSFTNSKAFASTKLVADWIANRFTG